MSYLDLFMAVDLLSVVTLCEKCWQVLRDVVVFVLPVVEGDYCHIFETYKLVHNCHFRIGLVYKFD